MQISIPIQQLSFIESSFLESSFPAERNSASERSSASESSFPAERNSASERSSVAERNTAAENSTAESVSGDSSPLSRAQKENQSGIFAKLLESIAEKTKTNSNPAENDSNDTLSGKSGKAEGKLKPVMAGNNKLKTGQEAQNSSLDQDFLDEEGVSDALFAFFGSTEPGLRQIETEGSRFIRKGKDFSQTGENSQREINLKEEGVSALAAGRGEEQGDSVLGNFNRAEKAERRLSGGDRTKGRVESQSTSADEAEVLDQSRFANSGLKLKSEGGERENSRLSELRSKKNKERLNIEVRDLRTDQTQAVGGDDAKGFSFNASKTVSAEIEIPVNLDMAGKKGEGTLTGKTTPHVSFEDALARELQGNLSTDIVRNAAIIVRNGGEGTIRLSLHPASLGDVKIRLEMTENKITGHIILQSDEALRAFERELPVLEKAFRDSGFSETNLEMFLGSENSTDQGNFGSQEQLQEGYFLEQGLAASRYEAESDRIDALPDTGAPNLGVQIHDGMVLQSFPGRIPVNLLV